MLKLSIFLLVVLGVLCNIGNRPVCTQVTFLYDIKRGDLPAFKRDFNYYLDYFQQLLRTDLNLIVFGNKQLQDFVWKRRQLHNTVFVRKELQEFKKYWFADLVEKARRDILNTPNFYHKQNVQYSLEYYCLLMFGKMQAMSEAIKHDKWNSDMLVWTDGGYMHQFGRSIMYPQNMVRKFYQVVQPQYLLITYQQGNDDLYFGYKQRERRYINRTVNYYQKVLASSMGGNIHVIEDVRSAYHVLLRMTLQNGDLNSDESILSLMPIKYPFLIPVITNTRLGDYIYKIKFYEDVNRIAVFARNWMGRVDLKGSLTVLFNANHLARRQEVNKDKVSQDSSQKEAEIQLQDDEAAQLDEMKQFFSRKKQADQTILYTKFSFVTVLVLAYMLILIKNYKIRRIIKQTPRK